MSDLSESERKEAELNVASAALKDPERLEAIKASGVSAVGFVQPYARRVIEKVEAGINLFDLEQLAESGLADANYAPATADDVARSINFPRDLERVKAAQEADRREALADRIRRFDGDEETLTTELRAIFKGLRPHKVEKLEQLEARRVSAAKPVPEPPPRFLLAGKTVGTPGNLVNIIAKAKSGKTAAIGAMIAAAITAACEHDEEIDTLGFEASNPDGKALLLIDTEQSQFDAFRCYMRALHRAKSDGDPEWLLVYALAGLAAEELKNALDLTLENAAKLHGGVFAVILDGVADFVPDVNEPVACNVLVAHLVSLAIKYDCPIVCVIHANENGQGDSDGRGHLGKDLTRKGESNLVFRKSPAGITTVTSEKQRNAPILASDGVAFKWSDEAKCHVSCGAPIQQTKKRKALEKLAKDVFGERTSWRRMELEKRIAAVGKFKGSTPEKKVNAMMELGIVGKNPMTLLYELVNPPTPAPPTDP